MSELSRSTTDDAPAAASSERRDSVWGRARRATVTNNVTRGFRTLRDMNESFIEMDSLVRVCNLGGAFQKYVIFEV